MQKKGFQFTKPSPKILGLATVWEYLCHCFYILTMVPWQNITFGDPRQIIYKKKKLYKITTSYIKFKENLAAC